MCVCVCVRLVCVCVCARARVRACLRISVRAKGNEVNQVGGAPGLREPVIWRTRYYRVAVPDEGRDNVERPIVHALRVRAGV